MTWRKRIGLALGLLSVVVLAAGLTMIVNSNSGKVAGKSASLMAEDYPVGTDYSGTITEQYVKVGDEVEAGQPIFEVESANLQRDLAQGLVNKDNLTYEVKNDNTLVITATNAGQVQDIAYADGAFVPANSTIATVQEAGTMYVAADFLLSAKDYARIPAQAELQIVLPNNQKITAAVSEIKVSTENGEARTIIKAYSDELANGTGLFAVGTPVESTLILTNDGIVTDVTNTVTGWFGVQA
jgi:multidrug efflux pump subunit AcrA (membrane-fusion protein)